MRNILIKPLYWRINELSQRKAILCLMEDCLLLIDIHISSLYLLVAQQHSEIHINQKVYGDKQFLPRLEVTIPQFNPHFNQFD